MKQVQKSVKKFKFIVISGTLSSILKQANLTKQELDAC